MACRLPLLVFAIAIGCLSGGCGIFSGPAFQRLSQEQQKEVDRRWDHLVASIDSIDRILLLDCFVLSQLHEVGADEVRFTSKKQLSGGGVAIVDITYFRDESVESRLAFTLLDPSGLTARNEVYTFPELNERIEFLTTRISDEDLAELPEPEQSELRTRRDAAVERSNRILLIFGEEIDGEDAVP
ncbi:MAG: hypothetical protein ACKVS9_13315 [Phycisphaerae bacterium]